MKPPKKTVKAIETIETMIDWLHYYMGNDPRFKKFVRNDVKELEKYLIDTTMDIKMNNIMLAKRLKALWEQDKIIKDRKIAELEDKLGESES